MRRLFHSIKQYWDIATVKTTVYEYVIEEIELCERGAHLTALIHYRAIGARAIAQASASDLNHSDIFAKFPPAQAQAIVTLATLEAIQDMGKEAIRDKYLRYIEKCAKTFKYPSKK